MPAPDRDRIAYAAQGLHEFREVYLTEGLEASSGKFHKDLADWVDAAVEPGGRLIGACPRHHAKTSIGTEDNTVRNICFRKKLHTVLISQNAGEARSKLENIKTKLWYNEKIRQDFGTAIEAAVDRRGNPVKDNDSEVVFNNGACIFTIGINGKLRGRKHGNYRPDMLIFDDPESDQDVESEVWREKAWNWVFGTAVPGMNNTNNSIIWLGTILHHDSLLNRMLVKYSKPGLRNPWPHFNLPALNERKEPLWPEYWTYDKLMDMQEQIGIVRFAKEYMNQPTDASLQVFKPAWWMYYERKHLRFDSGRWYLCKPNDRPRALNVYFGVDPAIGKTKHHDYFSWWCAGRIDGGREILLLEVGRERLGFKEGMRKVEQLAEKWRPLKVGLEAEGYQQALVEGLWDSGLNVIPVKHRTQKEARIESCSGRVSQGHVFLPDEESEAMQEFLKEASEWPRSAHDDQMDAMAICLEMIGSSTPREKPVIVSGHRRTAHRLVEGF